jgi:hypothetical protein
MRGTACGERAELRDVIYRERVVAMREQPRAVTLKDVREQDLCITRIDVGGGFGDGFA